jgi:hypothetical protein
MKFNWKDITLDLLHLVNETLWLVIGVCVGAYGVATQPETAELWRDPKALGLIVTLFVVMVLLYLVGDVLKWWWKDEEVVNEPA